MNPKTFNLLIIKSVGSRVWALVIFSLLVFLSACGGGGSSNPPPPTTGSLAITITGLPSGASAGVTVSGPNGYSTQLTSSQTLQLAPGSYTVTANSVSAGSSNYYPAVASQTATVSISTSSSVTVNYSTIIPTTTKVLDSAGMSSLTVSPDGSTITMSTSSAVATSLAAGNVLASGPAPAAPNGLLVRIISVSTSGQTVTASVQQATLQDAVQQATVQFTEILGPGNTQARALTKRKTPSRRTHGRAVRKDSNSGACAGNPNTISVPVSLQVAGGGTTVTALTGEGDFCPTFNLAMQFSNFQLVSANATVTLGADLSLNVADNGGFSVTQDLASIEAAPTTLLIGDVPVVVQPILTPFFGGIASSPSSISAYTGVTADSMITVGVSYANGAWSPIGTASSSTASPVATSVDGQLTLKGILGVQAGVLLDGFLTPYLSTDGYLQFDSSLTGNPCWTLDAGLEANVGVNAQILGETLLNWSSPTLNLFSVPLSQATNTCFAPGLLTVKPNTAPVMSPQLTIALTGSNFVPDSTANFNGQPLATTFLDPSDLTAVVPASDLAVVGTFPVTVNNPDNPGGTSDPVSFTVTGGAPTLTSIAVTAAASSITVGATDQFTATGTYSDGSTQNITSSVTWTSSNTGVATITTGGATPGLATGVAAGTTNITASSGTITSPAFTLTVTSGAGYITEYPDPAGGNPFYITAGADGALWFTQRHISQIGRITTAGVISEYKIPTPNSEIKGIVAGPDGNLWFCEFSGGKISKLTTSGTFTEYTLPSSGNQPSGITVGPDGALWFTDYYGPSIGRITTSGSITEYPAPTAAANIATGSDGALWFTEGPLNSIGRMTTTGSVTQYPTPTSNSSPNGITAGPDGALWFTEFGADKIGRLTTTGTFTEYSTPTPGSGPIGIITGPDGALWFAETFANKIGRITTGGSITEYQIPTTNTLPYFLAGGADGNVWFTEYQTNAIGRLTVTGGGAPTLTSIAVTAAASSITVGATDQFTATGTYSDGSTKNITSSVTWASSNTSVATIATGGSTPGLATGVAPGTTNITASSGSITSPAFTLTVTVPGEVVLSPTRATVPEGGAQTFTASVAGSNDGVVWTVQEGSAGGTFAYSTSTSAIYVPPGTTGTFHVVATSVDNSTQSAIATVTVVPALTLTVLHSFSGYPSDGQWPTAGPIQASDGNFYGTTEDGGASRMGTIFKMNVSGNLTLLHSFSGADGTFPYAGLIQGSDGDLYGTASLGGASEDGTVFETDTSGNLNVLYSFSGTDGWNPYASLIQASDGKFYGTTYEGGASHNCKSGCGTAFKMDAVGNLTVLHSFSGADGANPYAGVIQGNDGNFYGTTYDGGASLSYGTVFRMDASGNVTVLHSFSCSDAAQPQAALVQGSDGNFYGTTTKCGSSGFGTVFEMDTSGNLTVLHSFSGYDGAEPTAALVQGSDGNFYGTTYYGGASYPGAMCCGTAFRMDASGNVTVLHSFSGPDGADPQAALIQGSDGNFYGTTFYGGTSNYGTVFKIVPTPAGQVSRHKKNRPAQMTGKNRTARTARSDSE